MKNILVRDYTTTVTDPKISETILNDIQIELNSGDIVTVDFEGVEVMTTGCAAQIFGTLYKELGAAAFSGQLILKNVDDDLKIVIKHGILNASQK